MSKEKVDNSGKGNCMYYAYSISLMYFLLSKRDPELAEKIFTRLELTELQKKQLHALLNNPKLTHFSHQHIVSIIEPILGVATRRIASLQVKEELLHNPTSSSLFTAINYGMLYLFRFELEKNKSPLAILFADQEFDIPDYTDAEIYKVFNIKRADSELHQHIAKHYPAIIDQYITGWPAQAEKIYQEQLKGLKRAITENYVHQQAFLKDLVSEKKLDFPQVIKKFEKEWEAFLEKTYEESDKSIPKIELATKPELQYPFLQGLLPKDKLKFQDAARKFPAEWEAHVEKLHKEAIFTKEEIRANNQYQQQFRREMEEKTTLQFQDVIQQHKDAWSERVEKIYEEKKDSVSKDALSVDPFYHHEFLSTLIAKTTPEFFTTNNNINTDKYAAHLNVDFQWGSEETLILLHRYLQGEHEHRDEQDQVQIEYDNEISLEIYYNGIPKSGSKTSRPDMVLNNLAKAHWVSLVEPGVVALSPQKKDKSKGDNDNLVVQPSPDKKRSLIKTLSPAKSPTDARMAHLTFCGFNAYLEQLEEKAAELVQHYPLASSEAFALSERLNEVKDKFTSPQSTMTTKDFSNQCQAIVKASPKNNLIEHRGVGMILNGMLNALVFLANMAIGIGNLFYGKFELIDPNRIQTNTIKHINSLDISLEALKAIRARDTQKTLAIKEPAVDSTNSDDATPTL